jgi:hypothetical protein
MLDWLNENRYFVPAGTDDVVGPYIRPGAFFLALKLRPGNDVGDLQPVVVRYASDLPMIPIVLTSVAADPDMGVAVWILGDHRAIPRNYYHTVINDAKIDWVGAGANYVSVITKAANVDYDGRFGDLEVLRATTDAEEYVNYLNYNGYTVFVGNQFGGGTSQYPSQTLSVLKRHLAPPATLIASSVLENDYYVNISYYLGWHRMSYPELYGDLDLEFDPAAMTDELDERVVTPTLQAGAIFSAKPYLTRMFTTLSPDEMVRDPVFSFNPDLPDYTNTHSGRLIFHCGIGGFDDIGEVPATIVTADGWVLGMPNGTNGTNPWLTFEALPFSRLIQVVGEEGPPDDVVDNGGAISALVDGSGGFGCAVAPGGKRGVALGFILLGLCVGAVLRRRRAR